MTAFRPTIKNVLSHPFSSPLAGGGGGGPVVPPLPAGQAYLIDDDGNYLIDDDGDFLTADE